MIDQEEEWKKRWKEMLEEAKRELEKRDCVLVAEDRVECLDGDCVYDYRVVFAFKKYEYAHVWLKTFRRECDVVDYDVYYDSGIDAWILEITYHSHKH